MDVDLGLDGFADIVEIGRGGYGVVYRARQLAFDRHVAIKVLAPGGMTDEARSRFERECRAMGALSWHPHIVTIHDAGVTRFGQPFLVMELAPSGSFSVRLKSDGPLPPDEVRQLGIAIADALQAAHDAGVLHRDVKPENILLMASGAPALADFGIASVEDGTATRSGVITASVAHGAPEVLLGGRATIASDVYSLGSTLYAVVAGRAAFVRETDESLVPIVMRVTSEALPDVRALGCPSDLAAVIERAMAREPDDRWASARALGEALDAVEQRMGDRASETEPRADVSSHATAESTHVANTDSLAPDGSGDVRAAAINASSADLDATRPRGTPLVGDPTAPPRFSSDPSDSDHADRADARAASSSPDAARLRVGSDDRSSPPGQDQRVTPRRRTRRLAVVGAVAATLVAGALLAWLVLTDGGSGPEGSAVTSTNDSATRDESSATASDAAAPSVQPVTPSSLPPVFGTYRITDDGVIVRTGPGTNFPEIGRIPPETVVANYCRVAGEVVRGPHSGANGNPWWNKVEYQGVVGFVTDEYVDTQADVDRGRVLPPC